MLRMLSRARLVLLVIFGLASLAVVVSLLRDQAGFSASGVAAHLALYLFVFTEGFGPTAMRRNPRVRALARIILVPYTLFILVLLAQMVTAPASLVSASWKCAAAYRPLSGQA
jgi:hypothetical protein